MNKEKKLQADSLHIESRPVLKYRAVTPPAFNKLPGPSQAAVCKDQRQVTPACWMLRVKQTQKATPSLPCSPSPPHTLLKPQAQVAPSEPQPLQPCHPALKHQGLGSSLLHAGCISLLSRPISLQDYAFHTPLPRAGLSGFSLLTLVSPSYGSVGLCTKVLLCLLKAGVTDNM